jgi:hypothetical protein
VAAGGFLPVLALYSRIAEGNRAVDINVVVPVFAVSTSALVIGLLLHRTAVRRLREIED